MSSKNSFTITEMLVAIGILIIISLIAIPRIIDAVEQGREATEMSTSIDISNK